MTEYQKLICFLKIAYHNLTTLHRNLVHDAGWFGNHEQLGDWYGQISDQLDDLTETGIVLAGGGSRLYGMDAYLSHELGLEAHGSEDPETCVIMGTSRMLGNLKRMQDGPINIARRRRGLA